jgi:hypothetical protein
VNALTLRAKRSGLLIAAVIAVSALAIIASAAPMSHSAFTAKVNNTIDKAGTNSFFTCAAVATGNKTSALFQYKMADAANATTATDTSGHNSTGQYQGTKTLTTVAGPTGCSRGDAGSAYTLNGTSSYLVNAIQRASGVNVFTEEIWFKTTVAGGMLLGWGDDETGSSDTYDRHIYIDVNGHLEFGVWNTAATVVVSPNAVNDGKWHMAAATLSSAGMNLYVDGVSVDTDSTITTAQTGTGYWRIGYDNLGSWPDQPNNFFFTGQLRFAAVYSTAFTAAQIATDYAAGT